MRFLILTQYFRPEIGAPQTRLDAMARELVSRGHEVEVVTGLPNYPAGRILPGYERCFYRCEQDDGIRIHRVWLYASVGAGFKRLLNYLSFSASCLVGLLKSNKPDYLFIESPPLFLGVPGLTLARIWGVPGIFNVSDLWPDSAVAMGLMKDGLLIRIATHLERWAYRRAMYVTTVTESVRDVLISQKGLCSDRVLLFPNGVDLQQFQPQSPDLELKRSLGLDGKKIILYQGTMGFIHGIGAVLQTAALLQTDTDVHFLFVGAGSQRRALDALKSELNLANVTFLDPVPIPELALFLSIAECGLISHKDNAVSRGARPAKTNPIFASGKPAIVFGGGEGADLVRSARAGRVVPHGDIHGLAEAIRQIVRDPDLAAEFGRNGRRYAEQHLSWSAIVGEWLRQLEQRPSSSSEANHHMFTRARESRPV
ncbi:MAG: glycosyltransferase family 4 protein [Acidobacteriaceae bacterium]|nr:glycosyltransferase family 4 protein [Acidobacteriaceae bacterium]